MPLADQPRAVTGTLQMIGNRLLVQRQAMIRVAPGRIELPAMALLVASGDEAGTRRATNRMRDIAGLEERTTARQGIDVWCLDHVAAVCADIAVTQIISQDDHEIRSIGSGGDDAERDEHRENQPADPT